MLWSISNARKNRNDNFLKYHFLWNPVINSSKEWANCIVKAISPNVKIDVIFKEYTMNT
jgi:hypothetical protein